MLRDKCTKYETVLSQEEKYEHFQEIGVMKWSQKVQLRSNQVVGTFQGNLLGLGAVFKGFSGVFRRF